LVTRYEITYINSVTSDNQPDDTSELPLDVEEQERAAADADGMLKPHEQWALIKARLRGKGYTMKMLAGELNVSEQAVSDVRHRPNRRVQAAIGKILNENPAKLWPDRYTDDGSTPLTRVGKRSDYPKDNAPVALHNV
jgi:lambda repressor-like predicted transcriptional regulator